MSNKLVLFCDGACRPNPGFAGFGIFGFIYTDADKPKNHKHPHHGTLYFTPTGIQRDKSETPIAVSHVLEMIYAVGNPQSTNNEAELKAIVASLKKASTIENLTDIAIWTDSNYIVSAFNENLDNWIRNNWRRIDGKIITHISEWEKIVQYRELFKEKGCNLSISWVKGHTESKDDNYSHCNNIADIYSVIGSNYARINNPSVDTVIMDNMLTYADYKKSYADKDFVFYFRDMYFSSDKEIDDRNYCFISTSDDPGLLGKRNNSSIFATNIGYIPPIINQIKAFYREINRNYITTCCLKINKLENKDIYRLSEYIDARLMLLPMPSQPRTYLLVGDKTPFLYENAVSFPFIVNAAEMFSKMTDIDSIINEENPNLYKFDVTDTFIDLQEHKLKITNKDKDIDFSDLVKDHIEFKQKLIIKISYDVPSFLALKNIESDIEKVQLIIETNPDNNFCTVYINITTNSRSIYSVNIGSKYLRKTK